MQLSLCFERGSEAGEDVLGGLRCRRWQTMDCVSKTDIIAGAVEIIEGFYVE